MALVPFWHTPIILLFFKHLIVSAISYSLALQDALGSSYIFPALILKPAIFPRRLGSFYWKIILEIKIWVLRVLITTGMLLLLGPVT